MINYHGDDDDDNHKINLKSKHLETNIEAAGW